MKNRNEERKKEKNQSERKIFLPPHKENHKSSQSSETEKIKLKIYS